MPVPTFATGHQHLHQHSARAAAWWHELPLCCRNQNPVSWNGKKEQHLHWRSGKVQGSGSAVCLHDLANTALHPDISLRDWSLQTWGHCAEQADKLCVSPSTWFVSVQMKILTMHYAARCYHFAYNTVLSTGTCWINMPARITFFATCLQRIQRSLEFALLRLPWSKARGRSMLRCVDLDERRDSQ